MNRKLGGGPPKTRNFGGIVSHTYTITTDPDGTLFHTYSWGNAENIHGWNKDQPEDISAAKEALEKGGNYLRYEGDSSLDPWIEEAFNQLNKKENEHMNLGIGWNCKTETRKLIKRAKKLYEEPLRPDVVFDLTQSGTL